MATAASTTVGRKQVKVIQSLKSSRCCTTQSVSSLWYENLVQPELVVMIRGHPAEGLDHLLAELHRRRHRLRVPAQDVAEVDVEQFA